MVTRNDFPKMVLEALTALGGKAHLTDVAKHIWFNYQPQLEGSGKILFTWQYDMRWAATILRQQGKLEPTDNLGIWKIKRTD